MAREEKTSVMESPSEEGAAQPAASPPAPTPAGKLRGREALPFAVGQDVEVETRVQEGDKDRIQIFSGVVISIQGRGATRAFTVRRIVDGEGVERVFPVQSPRIGQVRVTRIGRVRRAKLYFLRERTGRSARLREDTRARIASRLPSAPGMPAKSATRRARGKKKKGKRGAGAGTAG